MFKASSEFAGGKKNKTKTNNERVLNVLTGEAFKDPDHPDFYAVGHSERKQQHIKSNMKR